MSVIHKDILKGRFSGSWTKISFSRWYDNKYKIDSWKFLQTKIIKVSEYKVFNLFKLHGIWEKIWWKIDMLNPYLILSTLLFDEFLVLRFISYLNACYQNWHVNQMCNLKALNCVVPFVGSYLQSWLNHGYLYPRHTHVVQYSASHTFVLNTELWKRQRWRRRS